MNIFAGILFIIIFGVPAFMTYGKVVLFITKEKIANLKRRGAQSHKESPIGKSSQTTSPSNRQPQLQS